ncbi:hypothetical protein OG866_43000 [Streptomyces sp. NBC_00663]|uniref:hypothetical protein n=1 Tax=Streptomyces sp. NBC_00663 TaxID=2975801 RepID=UPI002E322A7F|nr:hypothetical protein [Streptomyces sp. NBC_00663]
MTTPGVRAQMPRSVRLAVGGVWRSNGVRVTVVFNERLSLPGGGVPGLLRGGAEAKKWFDR